MTEATKRKHVERELEEGLPVVEAGQAVVQVLGPRGNNLHEGRWPDGSMHLISMPSKFRKHVYIKRGDFVIVDPIEEGDKVKGEICFILLDQHIRHLMEENQWPQRFQVIAEKRLGVESTRSNACGRSGCRTAGDGEGPKPGAATDEDGDTDSDSIEFENPNRMYSEEDSDSD